MRAFRCREAMPGPARPALVLALKLAFHPPSGHPVMTTAHSAADRTAFKVLGAISFSHFLNDTIQSLMIASYPLFKSELHLNFAQVGLITLAFQFTASLLQPLVGAYTDRHPKPFSLAMGMGFTLAGLLVLSQARSEEHTS